MPAWRISASTLREVPQAGLWKIVMSAMRGSRGFEQGWMFDGTQQAMDGECKAGAREFGEDECRGAGGRDAGEGIAQHPSEDRGGIGERGGGREPVGCADVGRDRRRDTRWRRARDG